MTPKAMHSGKRTGGSDTWVTPPEVFNPLHEEFHFTLDACATDAEAARVPRFYTPQDNGLVQPWTGVVWCNPPYSESAKWAEKAWRSAQEGATVVLLIFSNTETRYWQDWCQRSTGVRLYDGRIYFKAGEDIYAIKDEERVVTLRKGERGPAPKGSALVVFLPGCQGPPVYTTIKPARHALSIQATLPVPLPPVARHSQDVDPHGEEGACAPPPLHATPEPLPLPSSLPAPTTEPREVQEELDASSPTLEGQLSIEPRGEPSRVGAPPRFTLESFMTRLRSS